LFTGGGAAVSWADWQEDSEATLASDDTYVALFEGGLGENETGQGGNLSEVNRTLTQGNNVPGVVSGYRQLTAASSQSFAWVAAAATLMIKNVAEFTIILKCKDWTTVSTASDVIFKADTTNFWITSGSGATASKFRFYYAPTAGASDVTSANVVPDTGVVYFAVWRKGGVVRAAFKATMRPTKESDFAAGDTCESTQDGVYDRTMTAYQLFTDGARWSTIKAGYFVVAKKALFS
ncbi:MAG: hypothetical protein ABIL06_16255, partial [Pseudomonadota bacterium]